MRWTRVGLIALSLLGFAAIGYLGRDALATLAFRIGLGSKDGFHCSYPKLRLSGDLRQISVAPFACHLSRTPVRYFDTGQATITLRNFSVENVEVDEATIDYHPRDISNVQTNTLGDLAQAAGISDGFVKSMLDAADMYSANGPPVTIDRLLAKRGGQPESRMRHFHKSMHQLWDRTQIDRLEPTAQRGVVVHDLDMEVMPTRGRMRASVEAGPLPKIELRMQGAALDSDKPRMKLSL